MTNTFSWLPSYGSDKDVKPRVNRVDYGDGYSARVADGLNTKLTTRNLQFTNRTTAEIAAIDAFLLNEGGVTSFYWTPNGEAQKKWLCSSWKASKQSFNNESLMATFEEVVE
jgi:phage-related protein